jgi:hypothetical protein
MCHSATDGAEDVDAFLAGDVMPSAVRAQEERIATLLDAGGEMR